MNHLLAKHAPADLVAFGDAGPRTASDLLRDASVIATELGSPEPGKQVLLVFRDDRYAFAASLLGAWHAGHQLALPPNTQREAVLMMAERPETSVVLHDTASGAPLRVPALLAEQRDAPLLDRVTPPEGIAATLFTSGSTGEVQGMPKTARQLLLEADTLARAFDWQPGARVVSTVAPGHLYGLLFSVLTPLVSGGAFLRETPLHAQAVAKRIAQHEARMLVTVPAHVRGLGVAEPEQLAGLQRVFSSTAPLRAETAAAFADKHHKRITEVFGSTETGGIAWRQGAIAWQPLPGVAVSVGEGGHLRVDSPFMDDALGRPYQTADLAEAADDGGFVHRGRADGVVKVGGHRVSLAELEDHLLQQPGIQDAAVVAVERAAEAGERTQLLAVLVAEGWDESRLRTQLAERYPSSVLPRRVLFADRLPRQDNGKLQRQRLLRMFGLRADGRPINLTIEWQTDARSEQDGHVEHRFTAHVPEDYAYFDGHFPGYPILPGAAQLSELVMPSVRRARPELGDLKKMTRLKFLGRIQPDQDVDVVLSWQPDSPSLDFALMRGDTTCAGGRLTFEAGQ